MVDEHSVKANQGRDLPVVAPSELAITQREFDKGEIVDGVMEEG
jgi:hypothetical protein